jgi:iron complex outermembrane recepter protein
MATVVPWAQTALLKNAAHKTALKVRVEARRHRIENFRMGPMLSSPPHAGGALTWGQATPTCRGATAVLQPCRQGGGRCLECAANRGKVHPVRHKDVRMPIQAPKLKPIAQAALIALLVCGTAHAQERVEITGSSIKRLADETALPVQTIRREDIDKSGVTTAAELLRNLSASTAGLTDGASISDNTGGQRGFNGANLRGLGVSSTLVLLNGRRLANFASPGDAAGVDLNSIPAGAIQRMEVLKDGASAIYGTDAIGGVINFITRQDYQGADIGVHAARTQEGGAGKTTGTISGGLGNLATDRFNVFGVLDVQQLDSLRSSERDFLKERPLASTVPFYLSSRPYPGNLRLQSNAGRRAAQLAAINAAGYSFNGAAFNQRTVNLSAPGCNPPASVFAPSFLSQACGYDYMQDTEIYPESQKLSFVGRGVWQASAGTQVFAELMKSQAKTTYILSPNPTTLTGVTFAQINSLLPRPINDPNTFDIRFRATEAGNRSNEVTSDADRVVLGVKGELDKTWDYTAAFSRASNTATDRYVNGYFRFAEFDAAVRAGQINPFGPSSAAGKARIDALRIDDEARKSSGTTQGIDGKVTGTLAELAGGSLGVAVGAELRRETQKFTPSALLVSNNIAGDRRASLPAGQTDPTLVATSNSRNIFSTYGELNAPLTKELELQLALRYDKYQNIGSSTNPKLGLRWQPNKLVLLRGSAGTGFRAPSFSELYRPTVNGSSPAFIFDTVIQDFDQWPTTKQANPDLKPEKSKQFSIGVVLEPSKGLSASLDYWNIRKTDVISDLNEKTILSNPTRYAAYITRDSADTPTVLLKKENQGQLRTSGLDVDVTYRLPASEFGRFTLGMNGTYIMEYERQFGKLEPLVSNLGRFLNDQVIQRWRHRASVDWSMGAFGLTLGNTYYSAYTDDNYLPGVEPGRVKAFSLWDLSGSWAVTKQLQARAGINNLVNTAPPFSNQSYYFLSTFDPTYTDPRGRSFYASLKYAF